MLLPEFAPNWLLYIFLYSQNRTAPTIGAHAHYHRVHISVYYGGPEPST
jgi:hypothetical protein